MKMIKINNYPKLYIEYDSKIDKYLTDGVLDLTTNTFKKANKNPIKTFNLWVRVSKVVEVNGERLQKSKKKLYKVDGETLRDALDARKDKPKELLLQFDVDAVKAKELQELKERQAEAYHVEKSNAILNDVWDEFYKHKTTGAKTTKWRETTAKTYKSFFNVWMRDTPLGLTPLSEITKDDCISLIDEVHEQRTLRTATTVIEVLRPMFDWYLDKYDIDRRNPVPSKKDYKLDNARVIDISLAQVKKLYKAIDTYDNELMRDVFMWLKTGRRRGEVITLKLENIDTIDKTVLIEAEHNKAKVDMTYRLRPELEATIPDSPTSKNLFDVHKDTVTTHWGIIREKIGGTFKLNGKRVDFTKLHLHDLRHIIGGIMKSAEVPEEIRGKVLGHKRQGITERYGLDYYGDIDRAYQLFLDIVYGVIPSDTKWGAR